MYTAPVKGGKSKRITDTEAKESSAAWRPDGKKIGYLSAASGNMQLWEINPDGTEPVQVSRIEGGINGLNIHLTANNPVYKRRETDENIHDLFPDLPEANARLETDLMYRHWTSGTIIHTVIFSLPDIQRKHGFGQRYYERRKIR